MSQFRLENQSIVILSFNSFRYAMTYALRRVTLRHNQSVLQRMCAGIKCYCEISDSDFLLRQTHNQLS